MPIKIPTPLAWKNLTHDVRRLAVAVSGVAFAVILIFMELGFLNALLESTVQLLRRLKGEIVIVSRAQYALIAAERFRHSPSLSGSRNSRGCRRLARLCRKHGGDPARHARARISDPGDCRLRRGCGAGCA